MELVIEHSSSKVLKIDSFKGSLSTRSIYIYLPPDYDEGTRHYPVLYMHDGQNCFEHFVRDSYAGSWRADEVADRCIRKHQMKPCIIVGISNGHQERLAEYLPPYTAFRLPKPKGVRKTMPAIHGRADKTWLYYQEVATFIKKHYRVLEGRENTATCGSSMGGLFSTYLAWEHPEFAKHHAILSPSFWMTHDGHGNLKTIERIKHLPKRDLRVWLDSGEGSSSIPGQDDDNKFVTLEAREALLQAGYREGLDFEYYLAKGAQHHESAWAARLDKVFAFLFPINKETWRHGDTEI
jgi:predicted alpha/beta superfamily hydrolase